MENVPKSSIYTAIRHIIDAAKQKIAVTVNSAMVEAYWNIGRLIVEEEQAGKERAMYGDKLIPRLSKQLTKDFGKGFTATNLK